MNFETLPLELKLSILHFIDDRELKQKVSFVSKTWRHLCKMPYLRKELEITNRQNPSTRSLYLKKYCRITNLKFTNINDWDWLVKNVRKSTYLRRLEFDRCEFGSIEEIFNVLKKFPWIRELKFVKCKCLYNVCVSSTPLCKFLKSLYVDLQICSSNSNQNGVGGVGEYLSKFAENCPDLEEFDVFDSICMDDRSFAQLVGSRYEKLTKLSLNCADLSDTSYQFLGTCCNLTHLRLIETRNITDVGLSSIKNLNKIEVLQITHGFQLSPRGFVNLFNDTKFPNLFYLNFDRCWNLSNKGLQSVAKSCPMLKNLHLNACHDISDKGLLFIIYNCRYLEEITLYLDVISGDFLNHINRHLPRLIYLNLQGCYKITASDKLFTELKSRNPRLRIIRPDGYEIGSSREQKKHGARLRLRTMMTPMSVK